MTSLQFGIGKKKGVGAMGAKKVLYEMICSLLGNILKYWEFNVLNPKL